MNKKDKYYSMENAMEMNQGMGTYPYMGVSMMPMMSMMSMCPSMMPMNPMMLGMQPMMMDENMQDENYINYMINMNKYLSHMYKSEAYKLEAMKYMKDIE